jgi:hypothetical protein
MVVIHDGPIKAEGSYDVPLQPERPFWMLEYVSNSNKRKDYEENMVKYERELKVPYYLLFYPDNEELTLYRHTGRRYSSVKPGADGRLLLPQLDLSMAVLNRWVRFWYRDVLLPLPADLQKALDDVKLQRDEFERERDEFQRQRDEERRMRQSAEDEIARLRGELEHLRRQAT